MQKDPDELRVLNLHNFRPCEIAAYRMKVCVLKANVGAAPEYL
jgi:hypothetical protein